MKGFFPDRFNHLKRSQPAELTLHLLKITPWTVTTEAKKVIIINKFVRDEELDKQARCSSYHFKHFKAVLRSKADPRENPLAIILKERLPSSTSRWMLQVLSMIQEFKHTAQINISLLIFIRNLRLKLIHSEVS